MKKIKKQKKRNHKLLRALKKRNAERQKIINKVVDALDHFLEYIDKVTDYYEKRNYNNEML